MRTSTTNNLTKRFAASATATTGAIVKAPFTAVNTAVSGVLSTVFETLVSPIEAIAEGRVLEAPFDMVSTAVTGVGRTLTDTVASITVDAVADGVNNYLEIAGEDANPKTREFKKRYFE